MKVFVTGATGLVGSHVVERLAATGHETVALARESSDVAWLERTGARLARGDVTQPAQALAPLLRGCDAVVHAAAALYGGRRAVFDAVNIGGTRNVLDAAALAGVARVLHVSSIAVYGRADGRGALTEERWLDVDVPASAVYAWSKRRSEEAAWRAHEAGRVALTTVRPGVIYGERDRLATPWLARIARLPVVPLPRGGRTTFPAVYAGNVARAIVAALSSEGAVGRAYNVADGTPVRVRELFEWFGAGLGRAPRIVAVPALPLLGVARLIDGALRALSAREIVGLTRGFRRLLADHPYSSARAQRELGWTELVPHRDALARTARWWSTGE